MKPPVVYLYDINQATAPRAISEAQRQALAAGQEKYREKHTCRVCGRYQAPRPPNARVYPGEWLTLVEDGLCGRCETRLAAEDRAADIMDLDPREVLFCDTETTGLNKSGRDEILEVSVIDATGEVRFSSLVQTKDPNREDLASHIHGITREMLKDAPVFPDIFQGLVSLLASVRVVVVFNAAYDRMMIEATAARYEGLEVPQGIQWTCASDLFARWYAEWSRFNDFKFKSQAVACEELEVPRQEDDAHRAEYDCRLTLGVMKALAARAHLRYNSQAAIELAPVIVEPEPDREREQLL